LITVAQFCPLQEKNEVEALEKVQKKATKVLTKLKHKNCTERLIACKLPTLHFRHIRGT